MNIITSVILVLISAVFSAFGQIAFKLSSKKSMRNIFKNKFLFAGLFLYGFGTILFILSLRGGELTVLYPLVATSYIWTIFLANHYLKEKITRNKIIGILLIILGLILIF